MDGDAVEVFVEGGDEDGLPEAGYGIWSLAVALEPVGEVFGGVGREAGEKRGKAAGDGELVGEGECGGAEEREGGVERGGEGAGLDDACLTAGLTAGCGAAGSEEGEAVVPADGVEDAEAAVEVDERGAAADEDVLAIVDDLAGAGMFVGGGAATEVGAALEEVNAVACVGEGAGGGDSGQASADYGDGLGGRWHC